MKQILKPGDLITFKWILDDKIESGIGYVDITSTGRISWLYVGGSFKSGGTVLVDIEELKSYELITRVNDQNIMSEKRIQKLERITELYRNELDKVLELHPSTLVPEYYWRWLTRHRKLSKLLKSVK